MGNMREKKEKDHYFIMKMILKTKDQQRIVQFAAEEMRKDSVELAKRSMVFIPRVTSKSVT